MTGETGEPMKKSSTFILIVIFGILFLAALFAIFYLFAPARTEVFSTITNETEVSMNLTSSAFTQGQPIPEKFSCKGADRSPALAWTEPPAGTKSFALIMDDPDAPVGTWVHWVLFNIPASARGLPEAASFTDGSVQGTTSAHSVGYHGPCPPSGTHRYFFKLYALDTTLNLTSSADKKAVLAALEDHILAQAELMGTFSK